jgi:hypothetical protein
MDKALPLRIAFGPTALWLELPLPPPQLVANSVSTIVDRKIRDLNRKGLFTWQLLRFKSAIVSDRIRSAVVKSSWLLWRNYAVNRSLALSFSAVPEVKACAAPFARHLR